LQLLIFLRAFISFSSNEVNTVTFTK